MVFCYLLGDIYCERRNGGQKQHQNDKRNYSCYIIMLHNRHSGQFI